MRTALPLLLSTLLLTGCYTQLGAAGQGSSEEGPDALVETRPEKDTTRRDTTTRRPVGYAKDPGTATLFSVLITGGGHMYAGKEQTGAFLLLSGAGAPAVGYALSTTSAEVSCRYSCSEELNYTPLYVGLGYSTVMWLYGVATAGEAAREWNREHDIRVGAAPTQHGYAVQLTYRF